MRTVPSIIAVLMILGITPVGVSGMDRVVVSGDHHGFVLKTSGEAFTPWGVNYGNAGRLMEDFWHKEWSIIEADFTKMKQLGVNVVRIHLQFGKFMKTADTPDVDALGKLAKFVALAESAGLYLDVTGLACYRPADVPPWHDAFDEKQRWAAQKVFWRAVAKTCHKSPAIFCYDLMNEPMVPGGPNGKWYSGKLLGEYDFLQSISRDLAGRKRTDLAGEWIDALTAAIREEDKEHMVTVGMLPWVEGWGHLFGFVPKDVAPHVDFLSIHLYPETKKPSTARKALSECADHGKPVLIEETFPLSCTPDELEIFLKESRTTACGWVWHYNGKTPEEYDKLGRKLSIEESIWRDALALFVKMKSAMQPAR